MLLATKNVQFLCTPDVASWPWWLPMQCLRRKINRIPHWPSNSRHNTRFYCCVRSFVCACVANSVNAIDCEAPKRFSANLQHWCVLGQRWKLQILGSKGQSSRSQCGIKFAGNKTLRAKADSTPRIPLTWEFIVQPFTCFAALVCMKSSISTSGW